MNRQNIVLLTGGQLEFGYNLFSIMEKATSLSGLIIRLALVLVIPWMLRVNALARPLANNLRTSQQSSFAGQPDLILSALYKVIRFEPWQRDVWLQIGELEKNLGNPQSAILALQQAEKLDALPEQSSQILAELYIGIGDIEATGKIYDNLAAQPNRDADLFASLVAFERQYGSQEKTRQYLLEWSTKYPSDARPLYLLGLLASLDQPQQALVFLSRAVEIQPDYQPALTILKPLLFNPVDGQPAYNMVLLGRALGSLGEWQIAENAFLLAVESDSNYPEAWAFLSEARFQAGKDGSEQIKHALSLNPDSVVANAIQAIQYRRKGNLDQALLALYHAAQLESEQGIWQFEIANTLVEMDNTSEAYSHYVQATLLDPQNPSVWLGLANYCAATGIHLRDSGLPAARKAILLVPKNPDALDTMGRTMATLGDLENAIRYLEAALHQKPDHPGAHLHLAQVYLNLGDSISALEHLSLAQSYAINDPETLNLATRLMERYFPVP